MSLFLKREDVIHSSVRKYLKNLGWMLIAGEYPNGSDDELHSLRIMDPYFARDESPDHRRHSLNKLVPDLIAYRDSEFLVIEMKPQYSSDDEAKLVELLSDRKDDLVVYLQEFISRFMGNLGVQVSESRLTPALGFAKTSQYTPRDGFVYLLVASLDSVEISRN